MATDLDITAYCAADRCHLCSGTIPGASPILGRPCEHACHQADDRAIEDRLEREHFEWTGLRWGWDL